MLVAKNSTKKREVIPAGNYVARAFSMVHIGTVKEQILGEVKKLNKVRFTWELPTETRVFDEDKGEQPLVISKEYNVSMHEKSRLRLDIESWKGRTFTDAEAKSFDLAGLIGEVCMLNIIIKTTKGGNDFAVISNITSLPKGLQYPAQVNPSYEWNYEDKFDEEAIDKFPEFIRDRIRHSDEYRKLQEEDFAVEDDINSVFAEDNNDMPF